MGDLYINWSQSLSISTFLYLSILISEINTDFTDVQTEPRSVIDSIKFQIYSSFDLIYLKEFVRSTYFTHRKGSLEW